MRAFNILLWSASMMLVSMPVSAQFGGIKIGGEARVKVPGAGKKLNDCDQHFRRGLRKVAMSAKYVIHVDKAADKIASAQAELDAGNKKLSSSYRFESQYKTVIGRRDALTIALKVAKVMLEVGRAYNAVSRHHEQGQEAPAATLDTLDKQVAALARVGTSSKPNWVRWWTKEAARLRADNPKIARAAVERANRRSAQAAREKKRQAQSAMKASSQRISRIIGAGQTPIPADAMQDFATAVDGLGAIDPTSQYFYRVKQKEHRLYNAVQSGMRRVAEVLGGTAVSHGERVGKKQVTLAIKAEAEHCYVVFGRFKIWTGSEKVKDNEVVAPKGLGAIQRFRLTDFGRWDWNEGFCALKSFAAKYVAEIDFAGTRNGMVYAIVSWPKARLPADVSQRMWLKRNDFCDSAEWANWWKKPIPGTIVWVGREPFIVKRPFNGPYWIDAWNLSGQDTRFQYKQVVPTRPATRAVATRFKFRGCSSYKPKHPISVKLSKCRAAFDKKWDAKWQKLKDKKRYAKRIGTYRSAQKALDKLPAKQDAAWRKGCGKIESKAKAVFQKQFTAMVDWVTDEGPVDPSDIRAEWAKRRGEK